MRDVPASRRCGGQEAVPGLRDGESEMEAEEGGEVKPWRRVEPGFFHLRITHRRWRIGALVRFCEGGRDYSRSVLRAKNMTSTYRHRSGEKNTLACVLDRAMEWRPDGDRRTYQTALMLFRGKRALKPDVVAHEVLHALHLVMGERMAGMLSRRMGESRSNDERLADLVGGMVGVILKEGLAR